MVGSRRSYRDGIAGFERHSQHAPFRRLSSDCYYGRGCSVALSAGFRPFLLAAALWATLVVLLWLAAYPGGLVLPTRLAPWVWHAHEMIFGFAAASVAGFLLTAIPNRTGCLPLQGPPLGVLLLLRALGRMGLLFPAGIGAPAAVLADLSRSPFWRLSRERS